MFIKNIQNERWFREKSLEVISIKRTILYKGKTFTLESIEFIFSNSKTQLYILPLSNDKAVFCNPEFVEYICQESNIKKTDYLSSDSTNPVLIIDNKRVIKFSPLVNSLDREHTILSEALQDSDYVPTYIKSFYVESVVYGIESEFVSGETAWSILNNRYEERKFSTTIKAIAKALVDIHLKLAKVYGSKPSDTLRLSSEVNAALKMHSFPDIGDKFCIEPLSLQFCHGDFHLGQILIDSTDSSIKIIDFEGEPEGDKSVNMLPIEYDLACFCRSLSYLKHMSGFNFDVFEMEELFLNTYYHNLFEQKNININETITKSKNIILMYQLLRCSYEMAYEAKYRPHLQWIPENDMKCIYDLCKQ